MDSYHTNIQMGNMGYIANSEQNALPKWGQGDGTNNSSVARVVEVSSPELRQVDERVRKPSVPVSQGRSPYPSATNPSRMMYDRRRCA